MRNRYLLLLLLVAPKLQAGSHPSGLELAMSHHGVGIGNERLQAVVALTGAAIALGGTNALSKSKVVRSATAAVGLDADDVAKVVGISGSCAALSYLASEDVANGLWRFSKRAPVVGALFALTCSRPAQSLVSNIPVLGPNLVCPTVAEDAANGRTEPTCNGICRKCIMTKGITGTALYLAVDQLLNSYEKL
jgi:hypothetical protein